MSDLESIVDLLAATAEVCGTDIKPAALAMMAQDLSAYPLEQVADALARVRSELKVGRLTLAAVLDRISDGRPEPDEAWAMALVSPDESKTVVWTEEMAEAFAVARPLLEEGDKVGARMAFRQSYERIVSDKRHAKAPAIWNVSLGWDTDGREKAVLEALEAKRLSQDSAAKYLPAPREAGPIAGLLVGKVELNQVPASIRERCSDLRSMLLYGKQEKERQRDEIVQAKIESEKATKARAVESLEQWAVHKKEQKGAA